MSTPYSLTNWTWSDGYQANAIRLRQANAATVSHLNTSANTIARGGVVGGYGDPLKITPSAGMVLAVENGNAVVASSTAVNGAYVGTVPTGATVTLTAADATYGRYDRIVVLVTDIGTSGSTMQVIPVDGTPASSPVIPAEPANAITLAVVYVGAGVVSISAGNITDYRQFTAAAGGIVPVTSSASFPSVGGGYNYFHDISLSNLWARIGTTNYPYRNTFRCTAATRPTDKLEGTLIYETDTDTILCWDGSAWVVVVDIAPKAFTPVWTSSGTAPAIGNGTITGHYQRQGKMADVMIKMTCGSTSTAGTGTYYWSLPFAPASTTYSENLGTWVLSDSGAGMRNGVGIYTAGPKVYGLYPYNISGTEITLTTIVAGTPIIWNTNDYITFRLRYEIA